MAAVANKSMKICFQCSKFNHVSVQDKSRQLFPKDTEINHQAVLKKLQEILAARGKKSTDRPYQVGHFKELKKVSDKHSLGPALSLKISFNVMAAIFDSAPSTDTPLKPDMWVR